MKPMRWAWPIVVFFFAPIGLALYVATARAPGIDRATPDERKRLFDAYERAMPRRVNGAVIHCVAGDGLGVMTGMVVARVLGMGFWQEFWFEYAVGFAFGWFIFQYASMAMMTDNKLRALAMAFRAEFFSMLTVMGGMGAVMAFVTPMVVGMQPRPWTAAFWGFGALGLLAGYAFTFPMNWMIVKAGWKHGMGNAKDAHPVHGRGPKLALFATMCALGLVATVLPGTLAVLRDQRGADAARVAIASFGSRSSLAHGGPPVDSGLIASVLQARTDLLGGRRARAMASMDNALRAAQVAAAAGLSPGPQAELALRAARRAVQDGEPRLAADLLHHAAALSPGAGVASRAAPARYRDARVLDAGGAVIGEVRRIQGGQALVAVGGVPDFWGFWDLGHPRLAWVPLDTLVPGPARVVGRTFAMLPAAGDAGTGLAETAR